MGFLIFAARKLMLKRQINDKNYRLMVLSQQQQNVTQQISVMQQGITAAKNMTNIFASQALGQSQNEYAQMLQNGQVSQADAQKIQAEMTMKQYAAAMATQVSNSIFENVSQSQLAPLNALDTQISQEMASLESQLKQLNSEYENTEKAETDAAKQCAPRFGLG